jgi:hypothetical protein
MWWFYVNNSMHYPSGSTNAHIKKAKKEKSLHSTNVTKIIPEIQVL